MKPKSVLNKTKQKLENNILMNIDAKILIILITNINSIQQYVKRITECEVGFIPGI